MGFYGDLEELKNKWKDSSILKKLIIIFSFFIAFSSLTSLSDLVFQWKGFIKQGLEFYQANIIHPISNLLANLDLELTEDYINLFIVYLTFAFWPFLKHMYLSYKSDRGNKVFNVIAFSLFFGVSIWYALDLYKEERGVQWFDLIMILMVVHAIYIEAKNKSKALIKVYAPPLFAILLILILAAINEGLNR